MLRYQQKATEEQLNKIKEIQNAVKELPTDYFKYDEKNKRFELRRQISFATGEATIDSQYGDYLFKVGISIERLIKNLKSKKQSQNLSNIKYLVVIEGMSSNDQYQRNYELSYKRALALFTFWKNKAINFDPDICEVQIGGSGTGGVGRDPVDVKNQRFLIQIIPKIGEIK
jgi:flagellar motor protein MotB